MSEFRKVSRRDIRNFEDALVAFSGIKAGNLFNNARLEELGFGDVYPIAQEAGISVSKLKLANASLPSLCAFILKRRATIGLVEESLNDLDEATVAFSNHSKIGNDINAMNAYVARQERFDRQDNDSIVRSVSSFERLLRRAHNINLGIGEEHRIMINASVSELQSLTKKLAKMGFFDVGYGLARFGGTKLDWNEVKEFDAKQLHFLERTISTLNEIITEKKQKVFGDGTTEPYASNENPCLTATRFLATGYNEYANRTGAAGIVRDIVSDVYDINDGNGPTSDDYQQALDDLNIQPVDFKELMSKAEKRLGNNLPYIKRP